MLYDYSEAQIPNDKIDVILLPSPPKKHKIILISKTNFIVNTQTPPEG